MNVQTFGDRKSRVRKIVPIWRKPCPPKI